MIIHDIWPQAAKQQRKAIVTADKNVAKCYQRLKNSGKMPSEDVIAAGEKRASVPTLPELKSKWI